MKTKNNIVFRDYQEEAADKAVWALEKFKNNSLVVAPTGSGKSLIIAGIADRLRREILILQPSKEILAQNKEKLALYVPEDEIGVYSASFNQKDIKKYTLATIQSVYKKPELFEHIGAVLVDECHAVNPRNIKGMFTSFLREIGKPQMIGLTASPYRLDATYSRSQSGEMIATTAIKLINRMNPRVWNRIVFNINNHELVERGYLSPLDYHSRTCIPHLKIPINKSNTDFDLDAYTELLTPFETQIIDSINKASQHRKAVLVFCSSLAQAERMSASLIGSAWVSGATPNKERDRIIEGFKNGTIKVVFNVGVLTTGFDFPALDCIYLLRPTRSLALYYQMLGRGTRTFENDEYKKEECTVVDYTGTFNSLGRVEDIKLVQGEKLWEIYANGVPQHNRALYNWVI